MPREPDLGFGASRAFASATENGAGIACGSYGKTCTSTLGALDSFHAFAIRNLAEVKADIEADERRGD